MTRLTTIDRSIISWMRKLSLPVSRIAIFVVYAWFGALKVFGLSPASQMVSNLLDMTMPFIPPDMFLVAFGVFEVAIGVIFIIPGIERIAMPLLGAHMIMTALPLVLLPGSVWTAPFVPTLEGQYIIKNLAIIAAAITIAAHIPPWEKQES